MTVTLFPLVLLISYLISHLAFVIFEYSLEAVGPALERLSAIASGSAVVIRVVERDVAGRLAVVLFQLLSALSVYPHCK